MPRYLLDTNVLSQLVRDPASLKKKLAATGANAICTSIIAACELRFGARKKRSEVLTQRVDKLLGAIEVLPLEPGTDRIYGEIRAELESKGQPIGANDLLIAAQAIHADCVLVTDNQNEFRRVPGIRTENWLARGQR